MTISTFSRGVCAVSCCAQLPSSAWILSCVTARHPVSAACWLLHSVPAPASTIVPRILVNIMILAGLAQACGRPMEDPSDIAEARQALLPLACELWPPLCRMDGSLVCGPGCARCRAGRRRARCPTPAVWTAATLTGGVSQRWGYMSNLQGSSWLECDPDAMNICCSRCKVQAS